jgi:hypothetical protein
MGAFYQFHPFKVLNWQAHRAELRWGMIINMHTKTGFGFCLAAGLFSLTGPARLWAQATEGATPVAVGVVRADVEVLTRTKDWRMPSGAGDRASFTGWGYLELSTGVTDRLEFRAGGQLWQRDETDGVSVEGAGDLFLSAKWLVAGDEAEGAALAFMPYVKLPTAGDRWGDDSVDTGLLAIFGRPLGEHGWLNAQAGLDDYGDGAGGRDLGATASVVAGRSLGDRWNVYAEALGGLDPLESESDLSLELGGGATWAGNAEGTWGLDFAAYGGATRAAPDLRAVLRAWLEWGGR